MDFVESESVDRGRNVLPDDRRGRQGRLGPQGVQAGLQGPQKEPNEPQKGSNKNFCLSTLKIEEAWLMKHPSTSSDCRLC